MRILLEVNSEDVRNSCGLGSSLDVPGPYKANEKYFYTRGGR